MKVFIFDMDGTFVYSMDYWNSLMENYLRGQGFDSVEGLSTEILNMTLADGINYTKEKFSLPQSQEVILEELKALMAYNYKNTFELDPEIISIFKMLRARGDKVVLATATQRELVDIVLDRFDLWPYFDLQCVSDEMAYHKDDPRYFKYIGDHFKVGAEDMLVVEDALYAIKTANSMGIKTLGVLDQAAREDIDEIKALTEASAQRVGDLKEFFENYG